MSEITLLDGSIGQEMVVRLGSAPTVLWSTTVMMERPDILRGVHDDYFAAGATVATTNTYPVLRDRLEPVGLEDRFEALHATAIAIARAARAAHGTGRIAGALGPLKGSYRPDICPPAAEAEPIYDEIVALHRDHVDLLILESMSSVDQADGALRAAVKAGLPVWLAVTVNDDDGTRLRSGEPVGDLAPLIARFAPAAVLVNCSRPEAVTQALDIVRGLGVPFGAYANGFTRIKEAYLEDRPTVAALERRVDLDPAAYGDFALGWVAQGASIVGGCCEVGPAHIAELARRLRADGHQIV